MVVSAISPLLSDTKRDIRDRKMNYNEANARGGD